MRCDFLYLIGLSEGRIKIGRTINLQSRLRLHAKTYGSFTWVHLFPRGGGIEGNAIHALATAGVRIGRTEIFKGITKAQAIAICRAEIQSHIDAIAAHEQQARDEMIQTVRRLCDGPNVEMILAMVEHAAGCRVKREHSEEPAAAGG